MRDANFQIATTKLLHKIVTSPIFVSNQDTVNSHNSINTQILNLFLQTERFQQPWSKYISH